MANFNISNTVKSQPKLVYDISTLAPTAGEDMEIRVKAEVFTSHRELEICLKRLLEAMRERKEPKELSV